MSLAEVDELTGYDISVLVEHHKIHEGNHFFITGFQSRDTDEEIVFGITTPDTDEQAHVNTFIEAQSHIEIYVYEDSTFTGGTPVVPINNNRNSDNTSNMVLVSAPTVTDIGDLLRSTSSGKSGVNPVATDTGGIQARDRELVLKRNTKYIFKTISKDDDNIISFEASWYEMIPKNI